MDGILALNKPAGITSAKALYRVRSLTRQRKSGHAGTLDPAATGVLVLCLGGATRLVESIMGQPKVYLASARLDVTSATLDADSPLEPVTAEAEPSTERILAGLSAFLGTTLQVPPGISAVKVRGVPAYKRVRRGETLELKPRPMRVDWIEPVRYAWPCVEFRLCCGRGAYVRSIVRDLGGGLGVGGCLTGLVRERVGPFTLGDARTFEQIESAVDPALLVMPLPEARTRLAEPTVVPPPPGALVAV